MAKQQRTGDRWAIVVRLIGAAGFVYGGFIRQVPDFGTLVLAVVLMVAPNVSKVMEIVVRNWPPDKQEGE